ncbi:hypothetical protein ACOMHN_058808 [Nucella lapillus]
MLWLIVPPVLLVVGCFGNVMTIVVMRRLRASESTACLSVYFTALAVSDLCLLSVPVCFYWPELALDIDVRTVHDLTCAVPIFIAFVSSMTSAWLLVVMTCQRMMSVIVPHRVGVMCTVRRAKILTAVLVLSACAPCVYILVYYRVNTVDGKYSICQNVDHKNADIFYLYFLIVSSIIPFSFLVVANAVLIRGVIQSVRMARALLSGGGVNQNASRSAKGSSMTVTLILTSAAFFVLAIPIDGIDIYLQEIDFYGGGIDDGNLRAELTLVETIATLLVTSNSAVNFYLYVLSGRRFRQETKRCLCLPFTNPKSSAKAR